MRIRDVVKLPVAIPVALMGKAMVESVESAVTEVEISHSQYNHALVEGAPSWRGGSEKEIINRVLRHCRENRYWTPDRHDYMDDFMFHIADSYDHHRELFETP